jgi:short-subunit dehydrogenase
MPTVLITGATDGIGHMLAKLYAGRNDRLILVGRRPMDALDDPLFTPETYVQADLSQPQAPATIKAFLGAHNLTQLDLLVHNAGLGYYGTVTDQPTDNITALIDVNYRTPVALTHALVPYLKGGRVAFVSSVATAMPTPDYAVYTATKAALDAFAHNLRMELAPDVDVTLVHPGATRTGMHQKANMPGDTSKYPSAAEVAAAIQRAIDSGTNQTAIGFVNKALRFVVGQFPRLIDTAMKGSSK